MCIWMKEQWQRRQWRRQQRCTWSRNVTISDASNHGMRCVSVRIYCTVHTVPSYTCDVRSRWCLRKQIHRNFGNRKQTFRMHFPCAFDTVEIPNRKILCVGLFWCGTLCFRWFFRLAFMLFLWICRTRLIAVGRMWFRLIVVFVADRLLLLSGTLYWLKSYHFLVNSVAIP